MAYTGEDGCCCYGAANLPDRLWGLAGNYLVDFHSVDPEADKWAASFAMPSINAPDLNARLELSVVGRQAAVADFIANGAVRLETFELLREIEDDTDGRTRSILVGRNEDRSLVVEWLDDDGSGLGRGEADRAFEVAVELSAGSFAIWEAATAIASDEVAIDDSGLVSESFQLTSIRASGEWISSEVDSWTASSVLKVDVATNNSSVDCYPQGSKKKTMTVKADDAKWKPIDLFTADLRRNPASAARTVSYSIQGTALRRL